MPPAEAGSQNQLRVERGTEGPSYPNFAIALFRGAGKRALQGKISFLTSFYS